MYRILSPFATSKGQLLVQPPPAAPRLRIICASVFDALGSPGTTPDTAYESRRQSTKNHQNPPASVLVRTFGNPVGCAARPTR